MPDMSTRRWQRMKGAIQVLAIIFLWLLHLPVTAQESELPFIDASVDEAYRLAHEQEKVLMLVFGTEYCAPCRRLEREVLSREEVASYLDEEVVAVYLELPARSDEDEPGYGGTNGRYGEHYEIRGFPAIVFSGASRSPDAVDYPVESGRLVGLRYTAEDGWLDANIQSVTTRAELQRLWERASVNDGNISKSDALAASMFAAIKEQVVLAASGRQ